MSKTQSLFHIVFATKHREKAITESAKRELYAYIFGIIRNRNCQLIRMNGMSDHVHILVDLHPTVALASLVKDIKQSSSYWLKISGRFPKFRGWGEGYYAYSLGSSEVDSVKKYIMNQEKHHSTNDFVDEMKAMAEKQHLRWNILDWE